MKTHGESPLFLPRCALALLVALAGCGGEAAVAAGPSAPAPGAADTPATADAPAPAPAPEPAPTPAPEPAPAAGPAPAPAAAPQLVIPGVGTTTLEDGTRITVTADDKVIIEDPTGKSSGESSCGANGFNYRRSVEFMAELQQAVKAGDKEKVARLMAYPVRVNQGGGKHRMIKDQATFVRDYEQIIKSATAAEIAAADPRKLFCRYDGVMLGRGVIWASGEEEKFGVSTINP